MEAVTTNVPPTTNALLQLMRSMKVPVSLLLAFTGERIKEEQSEDVKELGEFLSTRASSKDARLVAAAGPALSAGEVAAMLGVTRAAVHKAKEQDRMLAYVQPGKRFVLFPAFQFENGTVAPWIPELIRIVGNGFAVIHFLVVERESLNKSSYLKQILAAPNAEARAVRAADALRAATNRLP